MTYQKINQCKLLKNFPNEVFKDIPGYEGLYQVSNLGRVKSLKRYIRNQFGKKDKILKQYFTIDGYKYVNLSKNNKIKCFKIHRLVLLTFKGFSKLRVNHKNGIKDNNKLKNLEYCTAKENTQHAVKLGLKNDKIKVKQYDKQGNFIKEYESLTEASKQKNIFLSTISACVNNRVKTAGGFIWKKN